MNIIANDNIDENFHVQIITPAEYSILTFGVQKIPYLVLANDTLDWSQFISAVYTNITSNIPIKLAHFYEKLKKI